MRVPGWRRPTRAEVFQILVAAGVLYLMAALIVTISSNANITRQLLQDHRQTHDVLLRVRADEVRFCTAAKATDYPVIIKILCPGDSNG